MKLLINIILLFLLSNSIYGINYDTINNENYRSPQRAALYSTFLPGLGQAYNNKYWKIPVIYAGLGTFTYMTIDFNNEFNRFKTAYILRSEGEDDEFAGILNEQALLNEMDRWRKNRDYSIIGIIAFYVLQIIDANVDAHMFDFDVSDDLSMRIFPAPPNNNMLFRNNSNFELKLVLNF